MYFLCWLQLDMQIGFGCALILYLTAVSKFSHLHTEKMNRCTEVCYSMLFKRVMSSTLGYLFFDLSLL